MKRKSRGAKREALFSAVRLIFWNWPTLLFFEVLYKLFLHMLSPLARWTFQLALRQAGIGYLSNENVWTLLTNPLSVLILLLLAVGFALCAYLETAALVLCFSAGMEQRSFGPLPLFWEAVKKCGQVFRLRNLPLLPFLLLLLPLVGVSLASGPLSALQIPSFILDFIWQNQTLAAAYGALMILLYVALMRWIFALHGVVSKNLGFREACRESAVLMRKKLFKTSFLLLVAVVFSRLFSEAVYYLVAALLLALLRLISGATAAYAAFWTNMAVWQTVCQILAGVFVACCNMSLLTVLYYRRQGRLFSPARVDRQGGKKRRFASCFTVAAACVLLLLYAEIRVSHEFRVSPLQESSMQVVAHRAGPLVAPENTLSALREAIKSGADYAEIDVQQTADGGLIVLHDTSFRRTAGVDRKVWEVTLEEARRFDAGRYFSGNSDGSPEPVPTLEEMLLEAKGKIGLMIELKDSGHAEGLEEAVVELIRRHGFSDCIVASMDLEILERVKAIAPEIRTVYISALAFGDLEDLSCVDGVSVEATFATVELMERMETAGKPLYVWTVNDQQTLSRLCNRNIAGIVTDNPYLALYVRQTRGRDVFLSRLAEWMLGPVAQQSP